MFLRVHAAYAGLFIIFTGCILSAGAQGVAKNGIIRGSITDSASGQPLESATIAVFDAGDSALLAYTLSRTKGLFELRGLPAGRPLQVLITFNGYGSTQRQFTLGEGHMVLGIGDIRLAPVAKQLADITVAAMRPPVLIKGDTLEFNAASFKTLPNAVVQDLLKKLPGIKVNEDGSITVNGKKVNRVLVDGRDFFTGDVAVTTQNLPAGIIDKVQVMETKTEEQKRSMLVVAPSDNVTVNLTLKKDKKVGKFGKLMAGYGTHDRYEGGLMINYFDNALQLTVVGNAGNTGRAPFAGGDLSGKGQSGGTVENRGIGGNFNNEYGRNLRVNGSYFYSMDNRELDSRTERTNILEDSSFLYNSSATSANHSESQHAAANVHVKIDSMSSVAVTPMVSYGTSSSVTHNDAVSTTTGLVPVNQTSNSTQNNGQSTGFHNQVSYSRMFRDRKTSFIASWNLGVNSSRNNQFNHSVSQFFDGGTGAVADTINQYGSTVVNGSSNDVNIAVSRKLSKRLSSSISYMMTENRSETDKSYYDYNPGSSHYDIRDTTLSGHYSNSSARHTPMVQLSYSTARLILALNAGVVFVRQANRFLSVKDSLIRIRQRSFAPGINASYRIGPQASVQLGYTLGSNAPTADQLSPVVDNSNPLYIKRGNPDLRSTFTHTVNSRFQLNSPDRGIMISWNGGGSFTSNQVVTQSSYDASGRQLSTYRNVSGVYSVNSMLAIERHREWKTGSWQYGLEMGVQSARDVSYIDTARVVSLSHSFSPRIDATYDINDLVGVGPSLSVVYGLTSYSFSGLADVRNNMQAYGGHIELQWPKHALIQHSLAYVYNSQVADGFQRSKLLWNCSVSYRMLKKEALTLKITAYDLLNRGTSVSRQVTPTYVQDTQSNVLTRYVLVSLQYNLNKFSGGAMVMAL